MQSKLNKLYLLLAILVFTTSLHSYDPAYTESNNELPNEIVDMKIVEKYGNKINLDLQFKNASPLNARFRHARGQSFQ